jgi:hypothetical protein
MQPKVEGDEVEPERQRQSAKKARARLEPHSPAVVPRDLVAASVRPRKKARNDGLPPVVVLRIVGRPESKVQECQ